MQTQLKGEDDSSKEIIRLFEKTRVAYLSARTDPKEYGNKWRDAVKAIQDSRDNLNELGKEIANYIDESKLEHEDTLDPKTDNARELYNAIKEMRLASELVEDPFAKKFGDKVLEALLEDKGNMVKFVHYAMRADDKVLPKERYAVKDIEPDEITEGLKGLDLEEGDIALYIIEQYGDDKDSSKVEKEVKNALEVLRILHKEKEDYEELKDIEKAETEKAKSHFLVPNKPMYRIFDIEDINELKGFSGNWFVQEKYDGMRVQLHKIDNVINIYSFNEKDITDKCEDVVKLLKQKHFGDCILDAELILFDGDEALHRADTVSHVFKGQYPDAKLRCHVFDIMRHEERDLMDEELQDRMKIIFNNYSIHSDEALAFPSKKDTREADNLKDLEEYSKEIMDMPTAEGVVIKDATSTYFIGTKKNPKWIKWKKFVDLDMVVLNKKKTKSNMYSYTLGAGPVIEDVDSKFVEEIEIAGVKKKFMNVGKATNTKIEVDIGDIIRVKVDEVKKNGDRYTLFSAKPIEIPEVEHPDKLVTLELLSQDTKRSLKYSVEALTKGIRITDNIHGEADVIVKSDLDGFVIYGFDRYNLMAKNAMLDMDEWKAQVEQLMKTKQSEFIVAIFNFLKSNGAKTPRELHNFLVKEKKTKDAYEDLLETDSKRLKDWLDDRGTEHGVLFQNGKFIHDDEKIMAEIKKYETPEEYRKGEFKLYMRKDDEVNLVIKVGDKTLNWLIELENDEELFDLFGKAGKYPAEVSSNLDREKTVDSGEVELGIQRHGYHEYFLKGNKFETKLHVRYLPVKDKKMWLAWTGFKQEPADKDGDEGVWNIYEDNFADVKIPRD